MMGKTNVIALSSKDKINYSTFEEIKHIDENGNEYWLARELQVALEYKQWRRFEAVISRAKTSCENSNINVNYHFANVGKTIKMPKGATKIINDHFTQVGKMINLPKGAKRKVLDYKLSRYACYLIVQNADPKKEVVALGQTYFAVQTRKQELMEKEYENLTEDEKRLYQRNLTRKGNYQLNRTAKNAGVKNFDKFHNAGYKGLYNGETADDIAKRKGLRYREDILDNMGSDELIANLFRISQTEQKLKRENVKTENIANKTHFEMGRDIRNFIIDQGGMMPEEMPTPKKSLKELEKENKLNEKK